MKLYKKREIWVDNVKVVACILVVLGHFFQSMVKSDIITASFFTRWFDTTVYYFHVPLFFICSGYLYQKYTKISTFATWRTVLARKLIVLGVPYVTFSTVTWILKTVFSSSVNDQNSGLVHTLLVQPVPPYWYLYILFIMFLITTPTKTKKQQVLLLSVSIILRLLVEIGLTPNIYAVDKTMEEWIWFVLGMTLVYEGIHFVNAFFGMLLFTVFVIGSVLVQTKMLPVGNIDLCLGLLACYSIISMIRALFKDEAQNKCWQFCARYTMPVFLMHTMCAAFLRILLIKVGVRNAAVHMISGIIITFIGPVVMMIVMERLKPLDFLVYPNRYLTSGNHRKPSDSQLQVLFKNDEDE